MDDWFMDKAFPLLFVLSLVLVFVLFGFAIVHNHNLFQECIADGHKAYECHALLRTQTVVVH